MKTFLITLALATLVLLPVAAADSGLTRVVDCTGPVCDAFCDAYNWIAANPWFDWIASNPWIRLSKSCPIL
jgi:hypothetical protein